MSLFELIFSRRSMPGRLRLSVKSLPQAVSKKCSINRCNLACHVQVKETSPQQGLKIVVTPGRCDTDSFAANANLLPF